MKNLHILPTDKPSRLFYLASNLHLEQGQLISPKNYQNIYITSDEEIKEGDWVYCLTENRVLVSNVSYSKLDDRFKITLTTDQDLIKDGVQAIDDEFLEWFVKNPSCEEVKVVDDTLTVKEMSKFPLGTRNHKYKIIIPKEEPKQETLEEAAEIEKIAMDKLKSKWGHLYTFGYPQRPFPTNYENDLNNVKVGLYEGSKWQAERRYSEEDMFEFSQWISHEDWVYLPSKGYWVNEEQEELEQKLNSKEILNMWFEQFKKK